MKATPGPDRKYGDIPAKVRVITRGPWELEAKEVVLQSGFKAQRAYIYRNVDGSIAFIKFRGTKIERSEVDGFQLEQKLKGWKESSIHPYDKAKHSGLLYGADVLSAMVETSDADTVLYLVGGEKDAETAWDLGQFATTPPNGEKSLSAEQLEILRGFKGLVTIVRDKDDPGTAFAAKAVAFLSAMGVRWEIKEAKSDTEGADLTDHVTELGFELHELVDVSIVDLKLSKERDVEALESSPVLDKFEGVIRDGEGWRVRCPGPKHKNGDKNPSLSVTHVDDRWLLFCHVGCDTQEILDLKGMDWPDLYDKRGSEGGLSLDEQIEKERRRHVAQTLGREKGDQDLRKLKGLDFKDPNDKLWSVEDIAKAKRNKIPWLITGFWAECSHGVIGGREKSLKSYWLDLMILAIVLGKPFLDKYEVKQSVVYLLIGEGDPSDRFERLQRMANDVYDMDLTEAEGFLYIRTRACPWDSDEFAGFMKESRDKGAEIVALDSVYNFQPPEIDVQNMYARGYALGELSQKVGTDRTLILVDHFRKTGSADLDLASLAQSAMGPWADSWILMKHRGGGVPEIGRFEIELSAGSRRGYNKHLDVSWHLGPFDDDEGCHTGDIAVTALAHNPATSSEGSGKMTDTGVQNAILDYMRSTYAGKSESYSKVREDMIGGGDKPKIIQVGTATFKKAWETLKSQGHIIQSGTKWIVNPKTKISMNDILGGK
ncbi:hypothetical protein GCM10010215_39940 [Streptomyces virginiae]|uniref:Uncharacterized protein n=1 Tax=Streptomyces virginiae TaxID=1961 RepID=A0ABQ3NZJ8_STRVG|nr:bifunctional DNA primase/helicase [Streptomyces virginiae]MBP2343797.1 hypothetical protein [Streptomyces virginiae]GGQ10914.1 hypothetical protein GCM10010215_39940 [Streptomyces virginiae]GHI18189.1 hypothetical protein Scinn_76520 [Streptomyces virginiae]